MAESPDPSRPPPNAKNNGLFSEDPLLRQLQETFMAKQDPLLRQLHAKNVEKEEDETLVDGICKLGLDDTKKADPDQPDQSWVDKVQPKQQQSKRRRILVDEVAIEELRAAVATKMPSVNPVVQRALLGQKDPTKKGTLKERKKVAKLKLDNKGHKNPSDDFGKIQVKLEKIKEHVSNDFCILLSRFTIYVNLQIPELESNMDVTWSMPIPNDVQLTADDFEVNTIFFHDRYSLQKNIEIFLGDMDVTAEPFHTAICQFTLSVNQLPVGLIKTQVWVAPYCVKHHA